jgi:hypothetical protein
MRRELPCRTGSVSGCSWITRQPEGGQSRQVDGKRALLTSAGSDAAVLIEKSLLQRGQPVAIVTPVYEAVFVPCPGDSARHRTRRQDLRSAACPQGAPPPNGCDAATTTMGYEDTPKVRTRGDPQTFSL